MRVWDGEDLGEDVNLAPWWVFNPKESWWITLGKSTQKRKGPTPYPQRYQHFNVKWQKRKIREVWWCREIKRVNASRRKEWSTAERSSIKKKKKKGRCIEVLTMILPHIPQSWPLLGPPYNALSQREIFFFFFLVQRNLASKSPTGLGKNQI